MKINAEFKCPICDFGTKIRMKRPGFLSPVTISFMCGGCESMLMSKSVPHNKTQLSYTIKLIHVSKKGQQIRDEEAMQRLENPSGDVSK